MNEYDDILNTIDSGAKVGRTLYNAVDANPDAESGLHKISRRSGIPVEALRLDNGAEAKRRIAVEDVEMLPSHSPRVAAFLSDPEKARVSHDDIEGLTGIERAFDMVKRGGRSIAASLWSTSEGLWGAPRVAGDTLEALGIPFGSDIAAIARGGQEAAREHAAAIRGNNSKAGFIEGAVYQGLESLGGNLLMAPATVMSGSPTPMLLGMSGSTGGKAYGEARETMGPVQSAIHGASQGAIEYATEMIPAARFVEAMNGKTLFSKAIKSVLGPDIVGEQVATVLQDLNGWVGLNPEKPFKDYLTERPSAAAQTLIATIVGTGGMVATAKGLQSVGQSFEKHAEAKQTQDFLIALGDGVKASKTFARLPDSIKALVSEIKQDGDVHDIYIPVERFTELFQSQGMDPTQAAEQILSDPSRFYEALSTGGDVAIPLEEFATLADAPFYAELAKDAKTRPEGMTAREVESLDQEKSVNDLLTMATEEAPAEDVKYQDAYQRIYDDTYGQLIGINQNPSEAQANATIRAKGLATLAQRYGYDPESLMAQFPIDITRGPLPGVLQKQPTFNEQQQTAQPASMLDNLRSGKGFSPSEMFGQSLGEFLRQKGIKDDTGELRSMDVDKGLKFKKKMLRPDGVSLDRAREAAVEMGYLPEDATINDLLEAVDEELRGHPKYAPGNINDNLMDEKLAHDELSQWLDMMDIDLSQTANEKIFEMMQQAVDKSSNGDIVEMKKVKYDPDQMTFDFREGTTDEEKQQAVELSESTPSVLLRRNGGNLLANAISEGLRKRGSFNFIGQKITSAQDLAAISQVYRNPSFETLRYFFVKGDSIVGHTGVTSRLPGMALAFPTGKPSINSWIKSQMDHFGADGFWMMHNHPSGAVESSSADRDITDKIAMVFDGFKGHVIINHNKFGVITKEGQTSTVEATFDNEAEGILEPSVPHPLIGRKITNPGALVQLGYELQVKDGHFLAVGQRGLVGISGLIEIPVDTPKAEIAKILRKFSLQTGSQSIFAVLPESATRDISPGKQSELKLWAEEAVENGFLIDAVTEDGFSASSFARRKGDKFFGKSLKGYQVSEEKPAYSRGSAEGKEALSVRKTQAEGMLLTAVLRYGVIKVAGIGATHYDVNKEIAAEVPEGLTDSNGFVTPDNKFLDRKQALAWVKENRPDAYKALDKVTKEKGLESQDYAHAEGVETQTSVDINDFIKRHFGGQMLFQSAYHGSPHTFDKFSLSKIGTGEGAQAYGHGLYFAGSKDVAEYYKETLSKFNYGDHIIQAAKKFLFEKHNADPDEEWGYTNQQDYIKRAISDGFTFDGMTKGRLYHVELAPSEDQYLLWDKPLSEQSEKVKAAIKDYNPDKMPEGSTLDRWKGKTLYAALVSDTGSDKAASEYLHSLGIRGIKYLDGTSRGKGEGNYNYVLFSDEDVTITKMEQAQKDVKRGYIKFGDNVPGFEIALLKDADSSTFVHELGHYYHELLGRLAEQTGAPDQLKADYQILLDWLGAENKKSLTVEQQEKFARGFEAYLYEGNAPSQDLRGVFQRFKTWLKAVYASLKSLNVELTNDVRGVFDRLLATDEEIAAAEKEQNVRPMYATKEDAGMSAAVFEAYKKLGEDAHGEGKDRLERAKLKEVKRTHQEWWKDARKKMTEEVEAEAKQNPVYEALHFLHNGKLFDGSIFEGESFKLSGQALRKMYDEPTLKAMRKRLGDVYRNEGGIHPQVVAEMFGFDNADEMIKKMMEAPKLKDFVKAETDRRMEEVHGKMTGAEIAEEAVNAVHNDEQAKLLREELKAIKRKVKEVKPFVNAEKKADREERNTAAESIPPVEVFKSAARQHIASLKVSEILPGKYGRAEAKAGKEAFDLNGKGKYAEAAAAKQRQILNHYLYREATEAREEADKIAADMRKLDKSEAQKRLGKAGLLEQVNSILDKYEFRRQTADELEARESLQAWMNRFEREKGFPPPVAQSVIDRSKQVNYRSISMQELRDVSDTVKALVFLARTQGKLLKDSLNRDAMQVGDEMAATIETYGKKKQRQVEKKLIQDQPGNIFRNYLAGMRAMSSLARQMDGGVDGGVIWNSIIRPLNEAGDNEAALHAKATAEADKIFTVYSAKERATMTLRKLVPGTDVSLSHWGRLMTVLNMGNEGNLDRLRATFSDKEIAAILETLDERDLQVVQDIWNWLESFKPLIAEKEKRVSGVEPQWVDALPLRTKFGVLTGGYFPIFYDLTESERAEALNEKTIEQQMNGGMFTKATTRRGHLEARVSHIDRKLDLDIGNIFQHVNQVIHDLTHHEALMDVNKLLGLDSVKDAMRDYYGPEAYRVFRDGITDVAVGTIPARNAFEWFTQYTRIGATTAALGWNIITSLLQPLGLTQSIVRIGPEWVAKGVKTWLGSPKKMYSEIPGMIYEKSTFMKHRAQSMNRELAEVSGKLKPGITPAVVKDSFFFLIQEMQKVVDIPTWLGQYEKSMTEHGNEKDAIAEADQAVIDAQAHGQQKDLSRFQRGGPMMKLFTMFSSYFVRTWNLTAESYGTKDMTKAADVGKFTVDLMMLYVIPAAISAAVFDVAIQAAIGGDPDEDTFWKGFFSKLLGGFIAPFPGLNQLSSIMSGYAGYEGPPGTRVYSEISKLAKQTAQGEADWPFWKSLINTGGVALHLPSGQTVKSIGGLMEMLDKGNPLSLFFGKPKK